MKWILLYILITLLNYLLWDYLIAGAFGLRIVFKCKQEKFMSTDPNHIDYQQGPKCAGFSTAYVMRADGMEADGESNYANIGFKLGDGVVMPSTLRGFMKRKGYKVSYCTGNIEEVKNELVKGRRVIAFIKTDMVNRWLHFIPVVGFDSEYIYIADSMKESENSENNGIWNRKLTYKEFDRLWNTRKWYLPLHSHTFFILVKDHNSSSNGDLSGGNLQ